MEQILVYAGSGFVCSNTKAIRLRAKIVQSLDVF